MNNRIILNESQVISLYQKGETLIELAKIFKLKSYGAIKRILKDNKITLRPKGALRIKTGLPLDADYFKSVNSPDKAYWLGYLTADGYVYPNGYKVTLCSKDREAVEKFKSAIQSGHAIGESRVLDKRTKKTYTRYSIQVTSKAFSSHLIALGLKGVKSFRCEPPNLSPEMFSHYVRGLFDGDGSICFLKDNSRRISLIATRPILTAIQTHLVKSLGFSKVKLSVVATQDENDICKLQIYRKQDQDNFLNYIYNDSEEASRLSRKYNAAFK